MVIIMNREDIAKTNFYIKRIINILSTTLGSNQKGIFVNGRHSDAFVFVLTGSCTYHFDDYSVTASEGDILYLSAGEIYIMDIHTEKYSSIYCDFEFDSSKKRKSNIYPTPDFLHTKKLFKKLMKLYPASFSEYMSVIYEIYGIILLSGSGTYLNPTTKNSIENSKKYIDANFKDSQLSIRVLAEQTNMSEVYYRKLFKSKFDISPYQYIIACRLKNARNLMNYTFLTLEECALQSGFSSLQHFCKTFKNTYGISPGKYRKEKLN